MNKSITIWTFVIILLVVVGILIFTTSPKIPTGKAIETLESIKVAYKPTSHYLSVFVADDRGFFLEEGLDAELVVFESSNQAMDAVLNGQVDVARGGIVLQFKIEAEKPGTIKTFLVNKQTKENFVDYILVHKDSNINTPQDLEGKKIGSAIGQVEKTYLENILKEWGLHDQAEIIGVKPTLLPIVLENKQVDAVYIYEPGANIAINKGFAKVLAIHPVESYVINPFIGGGVYMKASYIEENSEKAKKIMRAFVKAGEFIKDNPEESRRIIAKYTPLDESLTSDLHVLAEYNPLEPEIKEAAQRHADLLYENGILPKRIDVEGMFYEIQ